MNLLLHGAEWVLSGNYFCPYAKFHDDYTQSPIKYIFWIGVLGPILEELFFRKIMLKEFKKFLSKNTAIMISAGVFTVHHYQYWFSGPNVVGLISVYVMGVVCGCVFLWRSSFLDSFYIHSIFNLLGPVSVMMTLKMHIPCVAISIYSLGLLIFLNLLLIVLTLVLLINYGGDLPSFSGAIKDKGLALLAKFRQ